MPNECCVNKPNKFARFEVAFMLIDNVFYLSVVINYMD